MSDFWLNDGRAQRTIFFEVLMVVMLYHCMGRCHSSSMSVERGPGAAGLAGGPRSSVLTREKNALKEAGGCARGTCRTAVPVLGSLPLSVAVVARARVAATVWTRARVIGKKTFSTTKRSRS